MKNEHVSSLLADYIDGILSPNETASVKEHLAGCADCREEHRFLKAYLKKAAAFPSVPVPDDFLEKIHSRIDAPAPSGIIKKFFYPLKIKLPLEAAGALALTVLAVFIFRPFGDRKLEYHAEAPAVEEHAAGTLKEAEAPGRRGEDMLARDADRARPDEAAPRKKAKADTGRITVANGAESAKIASAEEKSVGETPAEISLVLKSARIEGASRSKDTRQGIAPSLRQKGAYSTRSEMAATDYTRADELEAKNQGGVDVIVNLAGALDGRVVKVAHADPSGSRGLVIVEIPAKNYAQFMAGIKGAWSVQKQTPSMSPAQTGLIRLTMTLQD
jgi:hypothetical protein